MGRKSGSVLRRTWPTVAGRLGSIAADDQEDALPKELQTVSSSKALAQQGRTVLQPRLGQVGEHALDEEATWTETVAEAATSLLKTSASWRPTLQSRPSEEVTWTSP